MIAKESMLHKQVCQFLKLQHPDVIFRTDFSAGAKMTMGQATRHKALQSGRAYPDIFLAEPMSSGYQHYCGLYIELKASNIYQRSGKLFTNKHLQEQEAVLNALARRGYAAEFAVGLTQAINLIDAYLGGSYVPTSQKR